MAVCSLGLTESQLKMYAGLMAQYPSEFLYRQVQMEFEESGLPPEERLQRDLLGELPILTTLETLGSTVPQIISAGQEHIRQCGACEPTYAAELIRAGNEMDKAVEKGLEAVLAKVRGAESTN